MDKSDALLLFIKYFSRALMLLLVMPLTNSARGLVAKWQGDDTSAVQGRITLNPMVHLDPLGSLMILLIGLGWSKPMPINPTRMKSYRRGIVLVSLTGPVTHFLSAYLCYLITFLLDLIPYCHEQYVNYMINDTISPYYAFVLVLGILAEINVCLGVINLLPFPGMDGFTVLNQFAGAKFHNWYYANYQLINNVSLIILLALFYMGRLTNGHLDPLGWLIDIVDMGIYMLAALPFLIFG